MNKITEFLEDLYQGETPPETSCEMTPEMDELLTEILEKLISYGLLNDPQAVLDWKEGLSDLKPAGLIGGWRKAKDHTGYLTLGQFREMCKVIPPDPSHKLYKALPHKAMEGKELQKRIAKMRQETGL